MVSLRSKVSFRPGFGTTISPSLVPKKHELLENCITCELKMIGPRISACFKINCSGNSRVWEVAVAGNSTPLRRSGDHMGDAWETRSLSSAGQLYPQWQITMKHEHLAQKPATTEPISQISIQLVRKNPIAELGKQGGRGTQPKAEEL